MISKVYISTYLELEAGLPHGAELEAPTFARLKMTIVRQPVDQFWIAFFCWKALISGLLLVYVLFNSEHYIQSY